MTTTKADLTERVSDIDLNALIEIYGSATEKVFAPQVILCLRELQRLRTERDRLREALEWIVEDGASDARAVECARAALKAGGK